MDDAAIDTIPIADEVTRRFIPRKGLRYLTCNPFCRRICCDGDVRGSFGDGIPDERLLLVAAAAEDLDSDVVDEIRRTAPDNFFTTKTPAFDFEKRGHRILNHLRLITLWPFQLYENKMRFT